MKFKNILRGRALYIESDKIWVARGMTFFAVNYDGKRVTSKYKVGKTKDVILGKFRLPGNCYVKVCTTCFRFPMGICWLQQSAGPIL
jgi:hypothetical protein